MAPARRVFLGYTSELSRPRGDGRSFVDGAEEAVKRARDAPVHMRHFTAEPRPPAEMCAAAVRSSDIVVIIVGFRWGSAVPDEPDLSYTEFEYLTAERAGIPRLVFLIDDALSDDVSLAGPDSNAARQAAFRRRILAASTETVATVGTPDELTVRLLQALKQIDADGPLGAWSMPARNPLFTGREATLRELAAALRSAPATVVQAIDGMGGVGKSALAVEYAHRHRADYDIAWWVPAEDPVLAASRLVDLARQLRLAGTADRADQAIAALHSALRYRDRWLVVFDNATDPTAIVDLIPPAPGHTVITSRGPGWDAVAARLPLDLLTVDDAIDLLRRRADHLSPEEARQVAEQLDRLPLALAQAGAFLAAGPMTVPTYLELVRTRTAAILRRGTPLDYPASFAASWEIAFERLAREHPAAAQLMTVCAYLSPEPIPYVLFLSHPEELPEPLAGTVRDPLAFADLTEHLRARALARVEVGSLQLHRLVQALLRDLDVAAIAS